MGTNLSLETTIKMSQRMSGEKNPMFGRHLIPWNKGKTGIYSKETLQKMSESRKGRIPWMKGKKHSEETLKKVEERLVRALREN